MQYDAIIIGAGPAGSTCAYHLAKAGWKVAIFDGSHPREKPCGGIFPDDVIVHFPPLAGFLAKEAFQRPVAIGLNGKTHSFSFWKHRKLYQASRLDLDLFCLQEAQSAGAVWIREQVKSILRKSNQWIITGSKKEASSEFLVGADGVMSLVRKTLGRPYDRSKMAAVCGMTVEQTNSGPVKIEFGSQGLGFVIPKPDRTEVGIASRLNRAKAMKKRLLRYAEESDWPVAGAKHWFAVMPLLGARDFFASGISGDKWLLVGDAAGQVNPLTGEGLLFSIWGAEIAAKCLVEKRTRDYPRLCLRAFGHRLSFSAALVRLFSPAIAILTKKQ